MVWVAFRAVIVLVGVALGFWVALHERKEKRNRIIGTLIIVLSLLQGSKDILDLGEYIITYLRQTKDAAIHDVVVSPDRKAVETFNRSGQPLWRRVVAGTIQKVLLDDLRGNQQLEVIIGVGGDDKDSGNITVYRENGDLRWSFNANTPYPYRGGTSNRLIISDFVIDHLLGSPTKELVALARDVNWYPSRAVLLNSEGRVLAEYWNPGHIGQIRVARLRGRERRVIIFGINNDLRQTPLGDGTDKNFYVAFAFDPKRMAGEAPPFLGTRQKGSHLWYLAVLPQGESISQLELLDRDRDGITEIGVWLGCGYVFYLSLDGQVIGLGRGDNATCDPHQTRLVAIR